MRMAQRPRAIPRINTYVEINGEEENISVELEYSPPEPDVNFAGGIEIVGVWCEDTEVSGQLTEQAFEDLEQRMVDEYTTGVSDDIDERADWEYEQRKDAMLEDRD